MLHLRAPAPTVSGHAPGGAARLAAPAPTAMTKPRALVAVTRCHEPRSEPAPASGSTSRRTLLLSGVATATATALQLSQPSGAATVERESAALRSPAWIRVLPVAEFKAKLDAEQADSNVFLVDTRPPPALLQDGHIAGAVNIPVTRFDDASTVDAAVAMLPKDKVLMFYCTAGITSLRAAREAVATGLLDTSTIIYVLDGGIRTWIAAGSPVVM